MPQINHENLIKEYWEKVKSDYPTLSYDQFYEICASPFRFVKFCMRENKVASVLIKFFGRFRVYPSKLKKSIQNLDYQNRNNFISPDEYKERKELRLSQLKDVQDGFNQEFEITE